MAKKIDASIKASIMEINSRGNNSIVKLYNMLVCTSQRERMVSRSFIRIEHLNLKLK